LTKLPLAHSQLEGNAIEHTKIKKPGKGPVACDVHNAGLWACCETRAQGKVALDMASRPCFITLPNMAYRFTALPLSVTHAGALRPSIDKSPLLQNAAQAQSMN